MHICIHLHSMLHIYICAYMESERHINAIVHCTLSIKRERAYIYATVIVYVSLCLWRKSFIYVHYIPIPYSDGWDSIRVFSQHISIALRLKLMKNKEFTIINAMISSGDSVWTWNLFIEKDIFGKNSKLNWFLVLWTEILGHWLKPKFRLKSFGYRPISYEHVNDNVIYPKIQILWNMLMWFVFYNNYKIIISNDQHFKRIMFNLVEIENVLSFSPSFFLCGLALLSIFMTMFAIILHKHKCLKCKKPILVIHLKILNGIMFPFWWWLDTCLMFCVCFFPVLR